MKKIITGLVLALVWLGFYWYTVSTDKEFENTARWFYEGAVLDSLFVGLAVALFMTILSNTTVNQRTALRSGLMTFGICLCFMIPSAWMSFQLLPERQDFNKVKDANPIHSYQRNTESERGWVEEDYGGLIDAVLADRDAKLKEKSFIMLGQWHTRHGTGAFYLYNPSNRRDK
jgi:hypothetical protein